MIGMYESEKEKALNGSAIAEQIQLATQKLSDGAPFEQAWKASGLSSNLEDYFDPADAVYIDVR